MLFLRLFVIFLIAGGVLAFFFAQQHDERAVDSVAEASSPVTFVTALFSSEEEGEVTVVEVPQCMPKSIGNLYFQIKTPTSLCSCLHDGRTQEKDIIAKGSSFEAFKAMCIDLSYKESSLKACQSINSVLKKNKKGARVDCECFAKNVAKAVSLLARPDFNRADSGAEENSGMFSLMPEFGNVPRLDGSKRNRKKVSSMYSVSDDVVTRCTR